MKGDELEDQFDKEVDSLLACPFVGCSAGPVELGSTDPDSDDRLVYAICLHGHLYSVERRSDI